MRIVSGKYKGRAINPPRNLRARPTTDFAKENLFNVLGNLVDFEQCDVLDLFAGTGSISYEFASRGARSVTSVEIEPGALQLYPADGGTARHRQPLSREGQCVPLPEELHQAVRRDFFGRPYDLEGSEQVVKLVLEGNLLRPEGIFIFEHSKKMDFSACEEFWQLRSYGSVQFSFFKKP